MSPSSYFCAGREPTMPFIYNIQRKNTKSRKSGWSGVRGGEGGVLFKFFYYLQHSAGTWFPWGILYFIAVFYLCWLFYNLYFRIFSTTDILDYFPPVFLANRSLKQNLATKCWGRVVPDQNVHEGNVKRGKNNKKLNLHTDGTSGRFTL